LPKVLIVEDDPGIAHLLGTLLGFEGYEVRQANDKDGVISALQQDLPDLAIVDVHLKFGDGFDLLGQIRAQPDVAIARTPVLMMSGMDYRYRCKMAGANGFLEKPFDRQRLLQSLEQVRKSAAEKGAS